MDGEGRARIEFRRHGMLAALRRKQWWSFEALDAERKIYFILLALEGFPSSYVSLKIINYGTGACLEEEHLGAFRSGAGDALGVEAKGAWGFVRFHGRAEEGWEIDARTSRMEIHCRQNSRTPAHVNRLLARAIDYHILQFPMNAAEGKTVLDGRESPFRGYGYFEHNWGVQPRHSTANWIHFWAPDTAGIVMDCLYDSGIPHHYTCLWHAGGWLYLASPAHFAFTPDAIDRPWPIRSPDLELTITPVYSHHSRMRIPPVFPCIDIDYFEVLAKVEGTAWSRGEAVDIRGMGKFDHNFNLW